MKTPFPTLALRAVFCVIVAFGLISCASPLEKRIARNPELYAKLPESDKALVNQGRIREGFNKEAVFLSWGRPDRVAEISERGKRLERWTYLGSQPVYTETWGWGGGWGGWGGRYGRGFGYYGAWDPYWGGFGGGPMVTYVPYKAASVTFQSNRVVEYVRGPE